MQLIDYKIRNQAITQSCVNRDTVSGSDGFVFAQFDFDQEWDGLAITVFFENDSVPDPVAVIWNGSMICVPPQALAPGTLRVSALGLGVDPDGNEVRLTTRRMEKGLRVYLNGAASGLPEAAADPALWEQVIAIIGSLSDLATSKKNTLVAAINEVARNTSGAVYINATLADGKVQIPDTWENLDRLSRSGNEVILFFRDEFFRPFRENGLLIFESFDHQKMIRKTIVPAGVQDGLYAEDVLAEQDPTVPDWAKAPEKPVYTADDVGAASKNDFEKTIREISEIKLSVGPNELTDAIVTMGAGWSGSLAEGFTHANGYTEPLRFAIGSADGDAYFIQGGCPNPGSTLIELSVGNSVPSDPYNGTEYIAWGVQSVDGGDLVITPKSGFVGTLTNLTCKKISEYGTEEIVVKVDDIGHSLPESYIGGMWNVQMGQGALAKMVNATRNVAIGRNALQKLVTGSRNVALGTFTLPKVEYADSNVAIGADSGLLVKTAEHCVAMGRGSMYRGAALAKNVAIGSHAMRGDKTPEQAADTGESDSNVDVSDSNVAVGYRAAFYSGADQQRNVAIGADAMMGDKLPNTAVQTDNVLIGAKAGYRGCAMRKQNVVIGADALSGYDPDNSDFDIIRAAEQMFNVAIGFGAGRKCQQSNNVYIGHNAAKGNQTGYQNVYIGSTTGTSSTGYRNTLVGASAKTDGKYNNCIAIGYNAVATKNNQAVIGNDTVEETLLKGNLVVRGTDNKKRKIIFNADGTCRWEVV